MKGLKGRRPWGRKRGVK